MAQSSNIIIKQKSIAARCFFVYIALRSNPNRKKFVIRLIGNFYKIERSLSDFSIWNEFYEAYTKEFLDIHDAPNDNDQNGNS